MVDLFFYNIFIISINFLMLITGQEPFTPLQNCFQEKKNILCNDLLKNSIQEHSIANNWELLVLLKRDSNINMIKKSGC